MECAFFNWLQSTIQLNFQLGNFDSVFHSQNCFSIFKHLMYSRCRPKWCLLNKILHIWNIEQNTKAFTQKYWWRTERLSNWITKWIESKSNRMFSPLFALMLLFDCFLCNLFVFVFQKFWLVFYFQSLSHMTTWWHKRKFPLWSSHLLCPDKCKNTLWYIHKTDEKRIFFSFFLRFRVREKSIWGFGTLVHKLIVTINCFQSQATHSSVLYKMKSPPSKY